MPDYVAAALHKFQHKPRRQPHSLYNKPQYGVKIQLTGPTGTMPSLTEPQTKRLQQVVDTFLFYARAVDSTMLLLLNALVVAQKNSAQATIQALVHFLNYCATHPGATLCYHASNMILHIHSNAAYLNETRARSRVGGHHFLGDRASPINQPSNGANLDIAAILKQVISLGAEAEVGATFLNGKEAMVVGNTPTRQNGTPVARHSHSSRHFDSQPHPQWNRQAATLLCHGHALLLDEEPDPTGPVQHFLGTWM